MAKINVSHTIFLPLESCILIHVLADFGVDGSIFSDFIAIIVILTSMYLDVNVLTSSYGSVPSLPSLNASSSVILKDINLIFL